MYLHWRENVNDTDTLNWKLWYGYTEESVYDSCQCIEKEEENPAIKMEQHWIGVLEYYTMWRVALRNLTQMKQASVRQGETLRVLENRELPEYCWFIGGKNCSSFYIDIFAIQPTEAFQKLTLAYGNSVKYLFRVRRRKRWCEFQRWGM